ncbi:glycosyltransferase family 4 protein [Stappia sp.]|uniref:glycosyltransferase family 4 protein n=1 Tax=Stappia sp. TaxID=1870903 RepID=UPI003A999B1D
MRILMACAAFPPFIDGGGPISALMLARMLGEEGHELRVVNCGDADGWDEVEGIEVRRIRATNVYWNYRVPRPAWKKAVWHALENGNPRAFWRMRSEIAGFSPDVLLTDSIENINVASWAAARSIGLPVAHTLRSAFLLCWRGVMQKNGANCEVQCASCRTTALGKRFFSRYVDAVCGESQDIIDRHRAAGYFPNAATRRIPGTIDTVADAPRAFPAGRPLRVGFIGVHTRFKGLDVLARAAGLLPQDLPVEFVIAGTPPGSGGHETSGAGFPVERTRFLGWSKPEEFYPKVDLLVFPSIGREAFGRVAIEAFAHGIPVIGSALGGIAETIEDGVSGALFPPGEAHALAERIGRIAADAALYEKLSAGALEAAGAYRRPRVAGLYTAFLEEAVARGAGRASEREKVA